MRGLISWAIALWLGLFALSASAHKIEGTVLAPNNAKEGWRARIRVLLDNGKHEAFLTPMGNFKFEDVPAGWHLVEVISPDYLYNAVRVEILESGFTRAAMANWLSLTAMANIEYPVRLHPAMPAEYFQKREGWSPFDLLRNPMMLMMLVMGGMAYGMPKLMEGMDQEALDEIKGKPVTNHAWEDLSKMGDMPAIHGSTHRNASKSSQKKLIAPTSPVSSKKARPSSPGSAKKR